MKIEKWLTVNSRGASRITHGKPTTRHDEISILLNINVPDELFQRPRLEAKINIPREAAGPDVLTSEVIENVQEAIEQSTGLDFSINIVKYEEDKDEN